MTNKLWIFSNRQRGENHPQSKLTAKQVKEIRKLHKKGFSLTVIAKNYSVSYWNIRKIVTNKTWTHV